MQDFRDNEKKLLKMTTSRQCMILFLLNIFMCYPCVSPYILFYVHGPAFFLCF